MPSERLQYLIDAIWQGSGATQQASVAIGNVGAAARQSDIAMAAAEQRSAMLGRKMSELGREVAKGNLSVQEASEKYKEFENTLADVSGAATKGQTGLGQLIGTYAKATAALAGLTIAAKKGYEAFKEGAALDLARSQFDNLAASVNSTGDAMLIKLRQASKSMATDAELIASASGIISTGLANTEDGVVRLANVSTRLGLDMQQVILTFANNSKARLDSLGLAVTDVTRRQQELVAAGQDLDSAFDQAVLEGLEARVALLGDASETTAGKIQQVETAWQNAVDAFKQQLAIGIAENVDLDALVEDIGELASIAVQASEDVGKLIWVLDKLSFLTAPRQGAWLGDRLREFWSWLKTTDIGGPLITANERAAMAAEELAHQQQQAADVIGNYTYQAAGAAAVTEDLATGQREVAAAARESKREIDRSAAAVGEIRAGVNERDMAHTVRVVREAREQQQEDFAATQEAIDAVDAAAKQLAKTFGGDFRKALDMAEGETVDFNGALFDQLTTLGASPDTLMAAGLALTDYGEEQLAAALKVATMNQAIAELAPLIADGTINVETARGALMDLSSALDEDYTAEFNTQELIEAQEEAERLRRLLEIAAGSYTAHFAIIQEGGVPRAPGTTGSGVLDSSQIEYASGTDGWERVPGPTGQPYPVTLHGGEMFNVVPAGQGGGGYSMDAPPSTTTTTINFYGTNPNEVIRVLQDRGIIARESFR